MLYNQYILNFNASAKNISYLPLHFYNQLFQRAPLSGVLRVLLHMS